MSFDKNCITIRVAIHPPLRHQQNLLASATVEISFGGGITIQLADCRYFATKDGHILFSLPVFRHAQSGELTFEPTVRFPKALDEMILVAATKEWYRFSAAQRDIQHDGPIRIDCNEPLSDPAKALLEQVMSQAEPRLDCGVFD